MRLKIATVAVLLSILLLGFAIHIRNGLYNPLALTFLTCSAIACLVVVFNGGLSDVPIDRLHSSLFPIGIVALCVFAAISIHTLRNSPRPFIDTFVQNRDSCDALLHGVNPYTITFPDIYEGKSFTYAPGMMRDGRIMMGYPYPPLPLLLQLPAYALFGDPRYASLLALLLTGIFFIAMDRRIGAVAALLLLFSPRVFYVLDMSWVDPFMILFLAATVWCALRDRRWLPIALGLFIASKQHAFLCLPLTILLTGNCRDAFKLKLKSVLVAAIVSLPMIIWNWHAFFENTVLLQFRLPFRDDSLSYLAWIAQLGGPHLPAVIGFVMMGAAMFFALRKLRPSPANFALSVGFSFFALFAFNKQAFCNYYFFVIGAMCCALAASFNSTEQLPAES